MSGIGAALLFLIPWLGVVVIVMGAAWFVVAARFYEAPPVPFGSISISPGVSTTITFDSDGRPHFSIATGQPPPTLPPPPSSLPPSDDEESG